MRNGPKGRHVRSALVAAVAVLAFGAVGSRADVSGFNSAGWTGTVPAPGAPVFSDEALLMNPIGAGRDMASKAFFNTPQAAGLGFTAQFTYQLTALDPAAPGEGVAFVLQNSPAGVDAIGGTGGSVGYAGIPNSLAVVLDVNQGTPRRDTTGIGTNGTYSDGLGTATAPVVLSSGRPIRVNLIYSDATDTLTETLTDLTTSDAFTRTYTGLNLSGFLGGNNAYVGFTAASGQSDNAQEISGFTFTVVPEPGAAGLLAAAGLGLLARRRESGRPPPPDPRGKA